jgi:amino acid transporter
MGIKYISFSWLAIPISEKINRGRFLATFLWNTSGFDMVGTCASEVLTPSYSYPRAFTYSYLLLIASNILPLLIASSILPNHEDWRVGTYVDIAKIIGGTSFKVWIGIVGMFSILGLLLIRLCTNSRILYGMAQVDQRSQKMIEYRCLHL